MEALELDCAIHDDGLLAEMYCGGAVTIESNAILGLSEIDRLIAWLQEAREQIRASQERKEGE